jgi:hypothetical protein
MMMCPRQEFRTERKVFDWVARQGHFRKGDEVGPLLAGITSHGNDSRRIGGHVAHTGIRLPQRDTK